MTREEAIKILKAIRVYECYPKSASEETKEALDMAIEALNNSIQMSNIQELQAENGFLKEMIKFYREQQTHPLNGEWIIDTYNMELKCEICGETFRFDNVDEVLDYKEYAKYCLACGARMGGDTK